MIVIKGLRLDVQGETIFENVNLVIRSGEHVGVLGFNDADVTAFLHVLAGDLEMDEGSVATEGERIVYINSKDFLRAGNSLDSLLASRPSFILFDSKNLDPKLTEIVKNVIERYRGGILLASENSILMQAAKVTRVLEIHPSTKTVTSYTGNYESYLVEREKNKVKLQEAYRKQQKEKKRLEDWLQEKRKDAAVNRSPQKGSTIRTKKKYLEREILSKEIPRPASFDHSDSE